jgi:hypothetical protein
MNHPRTWLLLHYKFPPRPSAPRVYVWRKLQRLGAIFWQDAVWILPDTPRTREQFQWMSAEIVELGSEAAFWEARLALPNQEQALLDHFTAQTEKAYRSIQQALKKKKPDLAALSRQFQLAQAKEYFSSRLGAQVRKTLLAAQGAQ